MYQFDSRVRYSEVDSGRKLTLPALLNYMQDCCTFQSEQLGVGVDYLAGQHAAWVLSSWEVEILRSPKLGDEIHVKTWPYDFKGFYGSRNFLLEDAAGETLVRANSLWVFMDTQRMRPARISDSVRLAYENEMAEPLAGAWGERKICVPAGGEEKPTIPVARYWIDTNHHMNNEKYVEVAEEYLPEGCEMARFRVEYRKAAVFGDTLYPIVRKEGGQTTVVLADGAQKPYAVVQFIEKQ